MGCCCCKSSGPDPFSKDLLAAHNRYRKKHGSPPLQWSVEAAEKAQEWADHLASTGSLQHGNHEGMGQNLAYYSGGTLSSNHTAEMWYNEIKDYNFDRPGFSSSTGHFTQLVWYSSKQAGFGVAIRGQTTYVVANYLPPGNIQGRFEQNVKPPV